MKKTITVAVIALIVVCAIFLYKTWSNEVSNHLSSTISQLLEIEN